MVNLFSASDDEAADEAAAASSGGLCDPFVSAMWGSWSWVTIGLIGIITTIMGLTIINYDYYMGYNGIIVNYNGIYKWDELSLAYHWIIWDLVSKWILICFFFVGYWLSYSHGPSPRNDRNDIGGHLSKMGATCWR